MTNERQYRIQMERCLVILTAKEINTLLQKDTEIFATALKRGKYLLRGQKQMEREQTKFQKEQE
ncbi:hypothetical protein SAMN05444673_6889 [Bacillus sp. OV166]|nr:hypothetical protein SAMN05444673_6889 [Bacillus sp. OV166]